jgi:hypothetical protein
MEGSSPTGNGPDRVFVYPWLNRGPTNVRVTSRTSIDELMMNIRRDDILLLFVLDGGEVTLRKILRTNFCDRQATRSWKLEYQKLGPPFSLISFFFLPFHATSYSSDTADIPFL